MIEAVAVVLGAVGLYVALGILIAIAAYIDARRGGPDVHWRAGEWATATALGPLTVLLLLLQRIIPDPPERPH